MNKLIMALFAVLALLCSAALAGETYTWKGTSGGSWNEPSNWSVGGRTATGLPSASDTAAISGVASIIVNSDAEIGGLTLTGSTGLTLSGNGKLTLGQAETVFNVAPKLTVSCELTGSGKLIKRGAGDLDLKAANTFTGGFLGDGKGGDVHLYNSDAFGTGKVLINHNTINIYTEAAITVTNDITFTGTDQDTTGSIYVKAAGVRFTGTVDFSSASYARLVSYNKEAHIGNLVLNEQAVTANWKDECYTAGNWFFDGKISGRGVIAGAAISLAFSASGNEFNLDFFNASTDVRTATCNAENVFGEQTQIRFFKDAAALQTLELNGHDQLIEGFVTGNKGGAVNHNCVIASTPKASTLTVKGAEDQSFFGKITGGAGIRWAPTGAYTLTLDAPDSDTTGTLIASNGTLAVTGASSFKNACGIEVYADSTLSFAAGAKLNARLKTLVLQEGAVFSVADGIELTVDEYYVVDSDGKWTLQPADTTYDLGNGVAVKTEHREIPAVEATWTAGGGDDTLMSTANNWNKAVDLTSGGLVATFASAGVRATVDDAVQFKGLVLDAPGITSGNNAFYFDPKDADAKIDLYENGIVERAPTTGGRTYDIGCPLTVWTDQIWDLPTPTASAALILHEKFVLTDLHRLEIRGGGKDCGLVTFEGANGEIDGTLVVTGANVVVKGEAWKNAGEHGKVEFWDRPYESAKMTFNNAVIGAEMEFYQMRADEKQYGMDYPLVFADNSTNVFNGKISVSGKQYLRFKCPATSCIVFAGGMEYPLNYPIFNKEGFVIVTNQPVKVNGWWHPEIGNTVLAVSGNCIYPNGATGFGYEDATSTGNGITLGGRSTMTIACDDVFAGNSWVHISGTAKFDLGGHDVHVGNVRDGNADGSLGSQFTSATPAVLTVSQLADDSCVAAFTGGAGIRKLGGKVLTMLAVSTSTGTVEVAEGTLDFTAAASWQKASSVTVSGGTLKLATSSVFGKKTDVRLTGGALDLAAGVNQTVADLYLNDSERPAGIGIWGASDNMSVPASHRTSLITGSGVLSVRGRHPGIVLILR